MQYLEEDPDAKTPRGSRHGNFPEIVVARRPNNRFLPYSRAFPVFAPLLTVDWRWKIGLASCVLLAVGIGGSLELYHKVFEHQ